MMAWASPTRPMRNWAADPALDTGPFDVRKALVLATTPRVSSSYLGNLLASTGSVGRPAEYLLPVELHTSRAKTGQPRLSGRGRLQALRARLNGQPEWETVGQLHRASLRRYVRDLATRRCTPNGVFSVTCHFEHVAFVLERSGLDLTAWDAPLFVVRLRRHDRLRQAVSLAVARQTRQWRPTADRVREPEFDLAAIRRDLAYIEDWERGWDRIIRATRTAALNLWMEDVVAEPDTAVESVLRHLGEAPLHRAQVDPSRWITADQVLAEEWCATALLADRSLASRRWADDARTRGDAT